MRFHDRGIVAREQFASISFRQNSRSSGFLLVPRLTVETTSASAPYDVESATIQPALSPRAA